MIIWCQLFDKNYASIFGDIRYLNNDLEILLKVNVTLNTI